MEKGRIRMYPWPVANNKYIESSGYGIKENGEYVIVFGMHMELPVSKEDLNVYKEKYDLPKLVKMPDGIWIEEQYELAYCILFGDCRLKEDQNGKE